MTDRSAPETPTEAPNETIVTAEDDYDDTLTAVLERTRTVAMIGCSPNEARPSNNVMRYLQAVGYRVIPVNPGHAGGRINGETVYADLASVPGPVDMVDIFRRSDAAGAIVDQAIGLAAEKGISVVWMQIGVRDDDAARRAAAAGLTVIMDRCPKIDFPRLLPERPRPSRPTSR